MTTPNTSNNDTLQPQRATFCLLCGPTEPATEIFPATINAPLVGADFSARKIHRRRHYRIIRCNRCGLVRSNPIFDSTKITQLYERSGFTYGDESRNLARAYLRAANSIIRSLKKNARIIDVGCGNGFYLSALQQMGFQNIAGIEPSRDAIAKAPDNIRHTILPTMFEATTLPPNTCNLVTFFHVLDHILQPDTFLANCRTLLKPGGYIHGVTHDISALPHRIFKERSVAYDIQHIYLFAPQTIRQLLEQVGFQKISVRPLWNTFRVGYLAHMAQLPKPLQRALVACQLDRLHLTLPVGNMSFTAQKP